MKPGSRVRVNIPGHPAHHATGVIEHRDTNPFFDKDQVVWIVRLDLPPALSHLPQSAFRPIGVDETELEEI